MQSESKSQNNDDRKSGRPSNKVAISLKNIDLSFPSTGQLFKNFSLAFHAGELTVVLGNSGSGKSTLLKIMSFLQKTQAGTTEISSSLKDSIGFVFQDANLLPWRTVEENLTLGAELKNQQVSAAKISYLLRKVGLPGTEKLYPRELSGGMKMRASLARALINDPQLILLDEPFSALDENIRQKLAEDLRNLVIEQKLTAVLVTHSLTEAAFLADRIIQLQDRPAKIAFDLQIQLPQLRSPELRDSPEFLAVLKQLKLEQKNRGLT